MSLCVWSFILCLFLLIWLHRWSQTDSYHNKVSAPHSMLVPTVRSYVSSSHGDNETTETIFLLPLAGKLHGDALWLGMPSMHSRPIRLTVSKRLKHVRLFKSNQRLKRLFRCIFHSVKNKKARGKGLRVDECANPDRPDWCSKWPAHLDGLKRPRAKHELNEWSSASCAPPELCVHLWILIKLYSFSALMLGSCEDWREPGWHG